MTGLGHCAQFRNFGVFFSIYFAKKNAHSCAIHLTKGQVVVAGDVY